MCIDRRIDTKDAWDESYVETTKSPVFALQNLQTHIRKAVFCSPIEQLPYQRENRTVGFAESFLW